MNVEFPPKLKPLFKPCRYKVLHGGRGGAKSWGVARALLVKGAAAPLRILCAREFQKSIKDSVHQLLKDQIIALGLESFYTITNSDIIGKNGTRFGFEGLKHNITNIKSWEGADICWVEEAQTVSKASWDILIPTIRKEGSEIWITFNPELEEDETYQRFVISPPKESVQIQINWGDNPWFPSVLKMEMEELKAKDYEAYLHIWEGHCRASVAGAIFAEELRRAQEGKRITDVPYDKSKPVDTFWDLGRGDKTAIWFAQVVGYEYRVLKYYEDSGKHFSHYTKYVQSLPFSYGTHYLPHDASHDQLAAEKSVEAQARAAFGRVVVLPRIQKKAMSIDAARGIFDLCVFDKVNCADGLTCLRRYAYKVDPDTGRTSREPEHDTPWSHGADAFQAMGMAIRGDRKKIDKPKPQLAGWQAKLQGRR